MRTVFTIPAALLLLVSVVSAGGLPQVKEGERRSAPEGMIQILARLQAIRKKANSQLKSVSQVARFAKLGVKESDCPEPETRAIAVRKGAEWPARTATSFVVAFHENRQPSALLEVPSSCSGDWRNEYVHYFDPTGRTIAFERYSAFFNGCDGGLARERSTTYYTPNGTVIAREYRLEDGGAREISPATCTFDYRHPYIVHRDWTTAARAAGLPASVCR